MEVKATERGYYGGQIREAGDFFALKSEKHFSANWMADVNQVPEELDDGVPSDTAKEAVGLDGAEVTRPMTIAEAAALLDHSNDAHWTADGKPKMEVIEGLVGDSNVTRADVEAATKGLRREA